MRLLIPLLLLALGTACPCPSPPCTPWLRVLVDAETWQEGRYELSVTTSGLALACTLDPLEAGAPPTLQDIRCDPAVQPSFFVFDTGGSIVPSRVELLVPLQPSDPPPATARLRVTFVADGASTPVREEDVALVWVPRPATRGVCSTDCRTATVEVAIPEASGP